MSAAPVDRELTGRAIVAGVLLGALLAANNVYVGLKIGFWDGGAITAAILGFALLRATGRKPHARETNVLATCASSAATMAASSGLIGPVAAIAMIAGGVSPWIVVAWSLTLAVLGILLALPLRTSMVGGGADADEGLPFPTGRATAEVITTMDQAGATGARRLSALLSGAAVSGLVAWFRDGTPSVIPAQVPIPGRVGGHSLESLTVSVGVSPLLLSAGALIGLRHGISILLGALIAWGVLAPLVLSHGYVPGGEFQDLVGWLLWPGAALLLSSTLVDLAIQWRTLARGAAELRTMGGRARPLLGAIAAAAIASLAIGWLGLDVDPVAALVAVLLTPLLAAACARAAGETDLAPVGPVGGFAQLVLGPIAPHQPVSTLGGGAIVNGAAAQTSQMMYAFRAGALVGSSTRALVVAQLLGAAAGALVVVPVYHLVTTAYGLGTEALPAGAALSWRATADVVAGGVDAMPAGAPLAAVIAAVVGVSLTLLERTRSARWLPSPAALGTAFLIPAFYSIPLFLGAALMAALHRARPAAVDEHGPTVAAGGIAGEALLGIVIALLTVFGVLGGAGA